MPDAARLERMPGVQVWDIVQTYLTDGADGRMRRVRRVRTGEGVRYVHTEKLRLSALSSREMEEDVSEAEYARLIAEADPALRPIEKRRYRVPWAGQLLEIDVYSFWKDRATLEVELCDEAQPMEMPDWIEVLRDVSGERAYSNRALAGHVPMEAIP